jgi:hypothetical protein
MNRGPFINNGFLLAFAFAFYPHLIFLFVSIFFPNPQLTLKNFYFLN